MPVFVFGFAASLVFILLIAGCMPEASHREENHVRGTHKKNIKKLVGDVDVVPPADLLDKGKVLMSYSDCFACHKEADRKRGPAFNDIAARYPMNSTYIRILAKRIILGNKGSWGSAVMPPHPTISEDEAETMVMYILSLDGLN